MALTTSSAAASPIVQRFREVNSSVDIISFSFHRERGRIRSSTVRRHLRPVSESSDLQCEAGRAAPALERDSKLGG
jgi:hypothetical protein